LGGSSTSSGDSRLAQPKKNIRNRVIRKGVNRERFMGVHSIRI